MSKHDDQVSMRHVLDHARQACEMASGRKRSDLESDRMLQLALTRLVEIVGEATSRVSISTREKYREIPWLDIVGMRNRLIHRYDILMGAPYRLHSPSYAMSSAEPGRDSRVSSINRSR